MAVTFSIKQGVAEVFLDHPPVNAPDSGGWRKIADTFTSLGQNEEVRCLILAARGKGFCAGVDIKELAADASRITQVNAGCWAAGLAMGGPRPSWAK